MVDQLCDIRKSGADICKLAVMPKGPRDVMRLMKAARTVRDQEAGRPLIAISMAGYGFASRITGEYFGSDVTFGAVGNTSAPGQLPVPELRELLAAMHQRKKIVLIGFMGCGKTTMGKTLAYGAGCPLCDTDRIIESEEGTAISKLFADKGETYFRERETAVLRELGKQDGMMIVSTGGGLPMTEANHKPLKELGLVVFLEVSKEMVLERLKGDRTRPLLAGEHPEKRVEELLKVRTPIYEKAADIKIVTG